MNPKQNRESVSPARQRAYDILLRVETERAYAAPLIAAPGDSELSREDRALAQEIVLGVLRLRLSLDYFIERYCERPVERLDVPVRIALRIGLYQLRNLARIPKSAAVNESVKLVKRTGTASAAGLVNAVLRKAARHPDDKPGDRIADPLRASVRRVVASAMDARSMACRVRRGRNSTTRACEQYAARDGVSREYA